MVYINDSIDVNTAFKKDPTVSKEFPMLASPRLYLDIFFQIYANNAVKAVC
jgi:hypothetical protein